MPELPEVQTTVSGLDRVLRGLVITDVWTEYNSRYFYGKEDIKDPAYFKHFKKLVKKATVTNVSRRAKNILIHLSNDHTILIHMKMTGHLLYGNYDKSDPYNRFIRLIFHLSNGMTLELCDARKFAKVTLLPAKSLDESIHLKDIGPEPLEKAFTFDIFKERLSQKPQGKIKTVLMDQTVIAGVGNIYSDESLWRAGIHPETLVKRIPGKELHALYEAVLVTLRKGIDFGGDSTSDYRDIDGKPGKFQEAHMAYRRKGEPCLKKGCRGIIQRKIVGGRSAHFCSVHQRKA